MSDSLVLLLMIAKWLLYPQVSSLHTSTSIFRPVLWKQNQNVRSKGEEKGNLEHNLGPRNQEDANACGLKDGIRALLKELSLFGTTLLMGKEDLEE